MLKQKRLVKFNCKHFAGNRPCFFHKEYLVNCEDCSYYQPVGKRLLIIKIASIGDVLRTTGLLRGLKEKYRDSHITWVTDKGAMPLFGNNDLVDTLLPNDSHLTLLTLATTRFDVAINLDAEPESGMLVTIVKAKKKYGYGYSKEGYIFPWNQQAEYWFQMGLSDTLKRANRMTYQQIMLGICQLEAQTSAKPIIIKNDHENRLTQQFRDKHGIRKGDTVIGLNTGAGKRWPLKKWPLENYVALINRMHASRCNLKIVLYGGPEERERNAEIKRNVSSEVIDSGCDNSIRETIAFLDVCDIVVTGDTLVMHMGIALNKHILLLLGPTSYHEIDLFGNGHKLTSNLDCLCCYKGDCNKTENCMNNISVGTVFEHIAAYLEKSGCSKS